MPQVSDISLDVWIYNNMEISKIYFDMDGVLADFDQGVEQLAHFPRHNQAEQDDAKVDAMWDAVRKVPHFYDRLEPMPGALEMLRLVREEFGERVEILTGLPKPYRNIPDAKADKRTWVNRLVSEDIAVNACIREDKIKYCKDSSSILIDDLESNIESWRKQGGTGILHTSPEDTLKQIRELAEL